MSSVLEGYETLICELSRIVASFELKNFWSSAAGCMPKIWVPVLYYYSGLKAQGETTAAVVTATVAASILQ
jgi:hypothetical protein